MNISGASSAGMDAMRSLLASGKAMSGGPPPQMTERIESLALEQGIDPNSLGDLHAEIETAVQEALEGLAPGADPREAIKSAVDGVLESKGIDPSQLRPPSMDLSSLRAPSASTSLDWTTLFRDAPTGFGVDREA
jgi:hypothetical protein